MAIYAMGDMHLSLGVNKPMDVFKGWENYQERMEKNCRTTLKAEDILVLPGDLSWGMNLKEALPDFQFVESLPPKRKIILKGNHDYFWSTRNKMEQFFAENNLKTLEILHNNAIVADGYALCGTRGWVNDGSEAADQKVILREAGRLRLSIQEAKKTGLPLLCFLHYPPVFNHNECVEIMDVLKEEGITKCYYGHIHGAGHRLAHEGGYKGLTLKLVSADYLGFSPYLVSS